MTRVNLVPVKDLADQHLFAEWRELKMIPVRVRKNLADKVSMDDLPSKYTMSTGHVRFFYDKLSWLYVRHYSIGVELRKRKFDIADYDSYKMFIGDIPWYLLDSWNPTIEDVKVNIARISERLNSRPNWYRYYGEVKPPEFFMQAYTASLLTM